MKKKIIAYVVSAVMVLTMVPATAFAATGTDDSGMSKTAPDALTQAQEKALTYLEEDVDLLDYDTTNATTVSGLVSDYTDKIRAATTQISVEQIYNQAKTAIGAVETAATTINKYFPEGKTSASYSVENKTKIATLKSDAIKALEDVTTNAGVDTIIAELKADVDAVPDTSGDAATTLEKEKSKANATLDTYINTAAYSGATYDATKQAKLDAIINGAKGQIAVATTIGEVQTILNTAKGNIHTFAEDNKSVAQVAYEAALKDALTKTNYADDSNYDENSDNKGVSFKDQINAILAKVSYAASGDYFYGFEYDYGCTDGTSGSAGWYIDAAREGTVKTVDDIADVVSQIKEDVAAIPTSAQTANNEIYKQFVDALDVAVAEAAVDRYDYDTLVALKGQYNAFSKARHLYKLNSIDSNATNAWATLVSEYNDVQAAKVKSLATEGVLYEAWSDAEAITDSNYTQAIAQLDEILAEKEKGLATGSGNITTTIALPTEVKGGAISDWKTYEEFYEHYIGLQTSKIDTFIDDVYDSDKYEYVIPTAEDMDKEDFEWDAELAGYVTTAGAAYKALSNTMKSDPNADTYAKNGITLAEAIEAYNTAKSALDAEEDTADVVITMIGRLQTTYVQMSDKDDIDATQATYDALSEYAKSIVDADPIAGNLEAAEIALVELYMKEAGKSAAAAGIKDPKHDWTLLTTDLIALVDTVDEMIDDYGVEVNIGEDLTDYGILVSTIEQYNHAISTPSNPIATEGAASKVAKIIKDIPRDPAVATEADFEAVQQARLAYNALLTDKAQTEFKRAGYLEWLERYEAAMAPIEDAKDLANATVTIVGDFDEGKLPQVKRGTTPEVKVTDANGNEVPATAYTVDCNEAHPAGKTSVIIRANDGSGYTGENEAAYVVVNNKKNIKSLTGAKKSFTVKYSDYSKHGCTGTEIAWKTSKNGEWKFSKITSSKASKKITVKKAGKKYVKVRAIVKVDGIRYYSDWSKTKTVTVK